MIVDNNKGLKTDLQSTAEEFARGFVEPFRSLLEDGEADDVVAVTLRTSEPVVVPDGPVIAIGDALHPMPPFGAHGANTALADATALAEAILDGDASRFIAERSAGPVRAHIAARGFAAAHEATKTMHRVFGSQHR